jgi:peptidoglycan-associated lipoprotein
MKKQFLITAAALFLTTACAGAPKAVTTREIYFGFDRDAVNTKTEKLLEDSVSELRENPKAVLLLEGHTDASGPFVYNMDLGDRRAQAVRACLVGKGLDPRRLITVSYGESKSVGAKLSASQKRRVVLRDLAAKSDN